MKEKGLKIVILILTIIILILSFYIFYDKVIDKDYDDINLTINGIDYEEFFEDSEELYAKFTAYSSPSLDNSNIIEEENAYYLVTDEEFRNFDTLRTELNKYFTPQIVNELLEVKVEDKYPLYKEINGKIYRFGGYISQYGYDRGENNLSIINKTDEKITIHNKIVFRFDDYAMEQDSIYEYDYILEKDQNGNFKFTNFKLPVSFYGTNIN